MGRVAQRYVQGGRTLCPLEKRKPQQKLANEQRQSEIPSEGLSQPVGIQRDFQNDAGPLQCGQAFISLMFVSMPSFFFRFHLTVIS